MTGRRRPFPSLAERIAMQLDWIAQHGRTVAGYRATYGDTGDGYAAIHRADMKHLAKLQELASKRGGAR